MCAITSCQGVSGVKVQGQGVQGQGGLHNDDIDVHDSISPSRPTAALGLKMFPSKTCAQQNCYLLGCRRKIHGVYQIIHQFELFV